MVDVTVTWTEPTPENTSFYELQWQIDGGSPTTISPINKTANYLLTGSGADIWGTADAFRFAYQVLSGGGTITARVDSLTNTHAWAKAGVMIRETLTAGSAHAMVVVTPSNGVAFQRRVTTNNNSEHTTGAAVTAPYWVRLTRSGNTFTAFQSANGTAWTQVGSAVTISMASSVYVGLALTSTNNAVLATASLSNVTVDGNAPTLTGADIGGVGLAGSTTPPTGLSTVLSVALDPGQTLYNRVRAVYGSPPAQIYGDWSPWGSYYRPPVTGPAGGFVGFGPYRLAGIPVIPPAGFVAPFAPWWTAAVVTGVSSTGSASRALTQATEGILVHGPAFGGSASTSLTSAIAGTAVRGQAGAGTAMQMAIESRAGTLNAEDVIQFEGHGAYSVIRPAATTGTAGLGWEETGLAAQTLVEARAGSRQGGWEGTGEAAEALASIAQGTPRRGHAQAGALSQCTTEAVAGEAAALGFVAAGVVAQSVAEAMAGSDERGQEWTGAAAEVGLASSTGADSAGVARAGAAASCVVEATAGETSAFSGYEFSGAAALSSVLAEAGLFAQGIELDGSASLLSLEARAGTAEIISIIEPFEGTGASSQALGRAGSGTLRLGYSPVGGSSLVSLVALEGFAGYGDDDPWLALGTPSDVQVLASAGTAAWGGFEGFGAAATSAVEAAAGSPIRGQLITGSRAQSRATARIGLSAYTNFDDAVLADISRFTLRDTTVQHALRDTSSRFSINLRSN